MCHYNCNTHYNRNTHNVALLHFLAENFTIFFSNAGKTENVSEFEILENHFLEMICM